MATGHAKPQVHPCVADLQAVFAAVGTWGYLADLIEMCALVAHCLLPFLQALPYGRATDTASAFCLLPPAFCLLPSALSPSSRSATAPQIIIRLIEPILTWRAEDIYVERVFERLCLVWNVGRDVQHFAGEHVDNFRFIFADPKSQSAFKDVSYLFIFVRMPRNDSSFFKVDMCQHHSVAGNETPRQHVGQRFFRDVIPTMKGYSSLLHRAFPQYARLLEPFLTVGLLTLLSAFCFLPFCLALPHGRATARFLTIGSRLLLPQSPTRSRRWYCLLPPAFTKPSLTVGLLTPAQAHKLSQGHLEVNAAAR